MRQRGPRVKPSAVFPAPDHDHRRCSADVMAHAEALCVARDQRLTATRRRVLEALTASRHPLGAYEIIDRLAASGPRPAPPTVYRALAYFVSTGPVPRIGRRTTFLPSAHTHESGT